MTTPSPTLLAVEGLTKHFPVRRGLLRRTVGQVQAVTDVSFEVGAGETLAIVGESGCGKSTTGRTLLRLLEPTAGAVRLEGTDLLGLSAGQLREMRRKMQIIFQDPYGSLNPRMTVREVLAEPLLLHGVATQATLRAKIAEVLELCGLSAFHAERYPHEFSGGQRQRVGIARALATRPRLIVCDEPVSALDVAIQAQILNLLRRLQDEFGLSYLFISHDLGVVQFICDDIAVMYLGEIVEYADRPTLFSHPRHPYTAVLLEAAPSLARRKSRGYRRQGIVKGDPPSPMNLPAGCAFASRCPQAQDRCRAEKPLLHDTGAGKVACHFPL